MSFWNLERDTYITVNRGELSAEYMAKFLKTTRNAVIGRSHRLKLPELTRSPTGRPKKERPLLSKVRKPPTVCAPPPMAVEPLNIPFIDLGPKHCREIVGYGDFNLSLSCGHPTLHESSWCRWHHSVNTMQLVRRNVQPLAA